ncbi:MAG: Rieske 2Fe-2S domain-containing protein [Leptospiraceae bacterium]|nr:Rieske 2Fe-2S domain-containing protein [Leptospiraceae bacterium]
MSGFDHWHPVLKSIELKSQPISVTLNGKKIVIFRNENGILGALDDACPHRRMALSEGNIKNGRITCIYHGMSFDINGNGESPGTADCKISAQKWDCKEMYGAIWIKSTDSSPVFPHFNIEGFHLLEISHYVIKAPLEIVLDNFTEVEHTPNVHAFLGYDPDRMKEVTIETQTEDYSVKIKNIGPQKKLPTIFRYILNLKKDDLLVDEWTTFFSPIYTVYDQYWIDSESKHPRRNCLRIFAFFNPIGDNEVQLIAFTYMKYEPFSNLGLNLLIKPAIQQIVKLEILRDKEILEKISDKNPNISGMKLTRFDRSLGPNRKRIQKIYRGEI